MPRPALSLERVLLTAWVGSLWVTGFMVAPTLFAMLPDRAMAGSLAGRLFGYVDIIGLVCGSALLFSGWKRSGAGWIRDWRAWCLTGMLIIAAVNRMLLAPAMQSLKDATGGVPVQATHVAADFSLLHTVSSSLYVLASLLGLLLVAVRSSTTASHS